MSAMKESERQGVEKSLSSGLLLVLQPSIEALDDKVNSVRQSQVALREQIDRLSEDLAKLSDCQDLPIDLEPYVKKLIGSRRRVSLVNSVLQNAQVNCQRTLESLQALYSQIAARAERLKRLNQNITKETAKKKAEMDRSLEM